MRRVFAYVMFVPSLGWNLLLNRLLSRWHWWDRVEPHLLVGALPFARIVPALADEGVCAVVNTCEEYAGPTAAYAVAGINQLRLPTVDFTPPSLASVQRGVDYIQQHVGAGKTVYVHCKAGRGRSATVALCWLVAHRGMTPVEAQALLQQKRPQVLKTVHQRQVVRDFCQTLPGGRG